MKKQWGADFKYWHRGHEFVEFYSSFLVHKRVQDYLLWLTGSGDGTLGHSSIMHFMPHAFPFAR